MANEIRKTSLGMQAIGATPLAPFEPARRPARADRRMHAYGLSVTILLHTAVFGVVLVMNVVEKQHLAARVEPPYQAIEAGLAFKRKSTKGPKSKLPQKEAEKPKPPPEAPKIASNPDIVPQPKEDKKREEKEAQSVFEKYRRMETQADDTDEQEGSDEGSEYGTLEQTKGDPYVGELIGRMIVDFTVPTVVRDQKLTTWGCVKLDGEGRIQDRTIDPEHKSRSHAFNSAVEERLKQTTDMDKPVPNYLKPMLVGKFVCATYSSRTE